MSFYLWHSCPLSFQPVPGVIIPDSRHAVAGSSISHLQAFLWHMICCIVTLCFMVGKGLEDPSVVDDMLNVERSPAKPSYAMAPDVPLVLHTCSFQNVTCGHSSMNLWELTTALEGHWEEAAIAAERIQNGIESLQEEAFVQLEGILFVREG